MHKFSNKDMTFPKESFKIYYFFNDELIDKLPTIAKFSHISLFPKRKDELLLYSKLSKPFSFKDRFLYGIHFKFDRKTGMIMDRHGRKGRVGNFFISNGEKFQFQRFYKNANYNIILYKNKYLLIVDDYYLNSFFIKAFILNKFDSDLFELISKTDHSKIFKLKEN